MTLPLPNHRALPVDPAGEDRVNNERRYRAEVERAVRSVSNALTQGERRLVELELQTGEAANVFYTGPNPPQKTGKVNEGVGSTISEDFNQRDWSTTANTSTLDGGDPTDFEAFPAETYYIEFDQIGRAHV